MSRVLAEPHTAADIRARQFELHQLLAAPSTETAAKHELKLLEKALPLAEAEEEKRRAQAAAELEQAETLCTLSQQEILRTADYLAQIRERGSEIRMQYEVAWSVAEKLGATEGRNRIPRGTFPAALAARMSETTAGRRSSW